MEAIVIILGILGLLLVVGIGFCCYVIGRIDGIKSKRC